MNKRRNYKPLGLFAMLAALLGIAGCKGGGDDVICMYGVPTMSYELKGKVTDNTGKPVKGIEVQVERQIPSDSSFVAMGLTAATDKDGMWQVVGAEDPAQVLRVVFRDVDGMENGGQFAESSTVLKDLQPIKDSKDTKNPFDLGTVKMEAPTVMMKAEY